MSKNNILNPEEEFFVISSDNLDNTISKLYGYICQNGIVTNDNVKKVEPISPNGTYVYVKRTGNTINITQDFAGCYGLYLYKDNEYFAISNSFLYLVDFVKKTHKITLNIDIANCFLVPNMSTSYAISETLVNEIKMLDRTAIVNIDIRTKSLDISYADYKENTVEIDSEEGIRILDNWYVRWINIIRELYKNNANIMVDLSGGIDSRMVFMLFVCSGIDLNTICINSGKTADGEDLLIAQKICDYYGVKLNRQPKNTEQYTNKLEEVLNIGLYTKLGFNKSIFYSPIKCSDYIYHFRGDGGECIRKYWFFDKNKFISNQITNINKYFEGSSDLIKNSVEHIISNSCDEIKQIYKRKHKKIENEDIGMALYRESRCRNHFGKSHVEWFLLHNDVTPSPLFDCNLRRLTLNSEKCEDKDLLTAIILSRYSEPLISFEIQGNRTICPKTVNYAKNINKRHPLKIKLDSIEKISTDNTIGRICENIQDASCRTEALRCITKCSRSKNIRDLFCKYYENNIYKMIIKNDKIFSKKKRIIREAYSIISISKIIQAVLESNKNIQHISDFIMQNNNQKTVQKIYLVPNNKFKKLIYYAKKLCKIIH